MKTRRGIAAVVMVFAIVSCAHAASRRANVREERVPELLLPEGRKLTYMRAIYSQQDLHAKKSFFAKVLDFVAGPAEVHALVRPYGVAVDSEQRMIVTDPGIPGIHVFDLRRQKYHLIDARQAKLMKAPQCVAVEGDLIYVTDSAAGVIFIFDRENKLKKTIGALKGGEGFFKRPTGIAVAPGGDRIYVSDTLRNKVFVLDRDGVVITTIGTSGDAAGEMNFPTELRISGDELYVVDAMNFRVQIFSLAGTLKATIHDGSFFRLKGMASDSEHDIYVVNGIDSRIDVFNRDGVLLYNFGAEGTEAAQFQLPAGLFIDVNDTIYVVDSFNRRVQMFQYSPATMLKGGRP